MKAAWLAEVVAGRAPERTGARARGVAFHTGRLRPGDAFFALPGESVHGIRFADEALRRGAAFIVSDAPHPQGVLVDDPGEALLALARWARAQRRGPVIGVTGSAGKTTAKTLMAAALMAESTPGNYNTPLALAATLVNAQLGPTPAAPLVLELGIDHVGEMARLTALVRPTHGFLTLVAPSHLHGLGDLASVAREKALLLEAAPQAFASAQAAAFLPEALLGRVVTYGLGTEDASERALRVVSDGYSQTLAYRGARVRLPYPGDAVAQAAVAALVAAHALALPLKAAAQRVERAELEPGRLQMRPQGDLLVLDDSYNSNPASAAVALAVLRGLPRPHVAVLGDMLELGQDSRKYHLELGRQTVGLDLVIAIGPEAAAITEANPAGRHFETLREAMPLLLGWPRRGTILVKASRGMRFEQVVGLLLRQETLA